MSDLVAAAAGTQPVPGVLDLMCRHPDVSIRALGYLLKATASQDEIAALQRSYDASERFESADPSERFESADPSDEAIVRRVLERSSKQIRDAAPLAFSLFGARRSD